MNKKIFTFIDYNFLAKINLILSLLMLIIFPICLILRREINIPLVIFFLGLILLIITLLFGIKMYKINLKTNIIYFPKFSCKLSEISSINIENEKEDIFLPKHDDSRLMNQDQFSRYIEYEEYKLNVYLLILNGKFGTKKFTFYTAQVRNKIYEILKLNIT